MENLGRRLTRDEALQLRQALGYAGLIVGALCILAPRRLSAMAGLPRGRRDAWWVRLFGIRELALFAALAGARDCESTRAAAQAVALAQVGDLAVSTAMLVSGSLSIRAWLSVALAAPPALLAATAISENLRTR